MTTAIEKQTSVSTPLDRMALRGYYGLNLMVILGMGCLSAPGQAAIKETAETITKMTENTKRGYNAFESYVTAQALKHR